MIDPAEFGNILDETVKRLGAEVRASTAYHDPKAFEKRVLEVMQEIAEGRGIKIAPTFHAHAFPDITANGFGIEIKSTTKDSWLTVGNSVFEGMRDPSVKQIYVVFGKFGGMPGVKWGKYEERITHVRISHAPRFVLEMDRDSPLFGKHLPVTYDQFSQLTPEDKMRHIRKYSRNRLQPGERLWWLEDERNDQGLPVAVRLYMSLTKEEKINLRAEGALLFPQIVKGSRHRQKYEDVALYFLAHHGIFAPQTRDLFSAGSVAGKARGGNYILRALQSIQGAMREAAERLDDELFLEYWGELVPREKRIERWLAMADFHATTWKPSDHLFRKE